eukprot:TRINITY_DN14846_c0_g1_i1.p1 TRINITY_DN14846_c0_g1~~TRINITY_DN14846_c0_g1_i1.p1  ORF type:complete len:379 (-),score=123.21 TRINITY_DN14846_c0_g1_i1:63-1199(-)
MPPKVVKKLVPQNVLTESKQSSHKCVMCEANLSSKAELQAHFRLHANGEIDMKGRCTKSLEATKPEHNVSSKVAPTAGAKEIVWISCDVCQESFETVTLAIQHKFRKHPNSNKKYYCGFCGRQYPLEICRENHIKSDHKKDTRGKQIYKCKDCTAEFFTVDAIKYHIRSSHQRVTALINPTATFGPSKKIKMNISGEPNSVFYCHLCGHEYMVKFNLQKHLEANHTAEERNGPPEQLIKCKLCEAMFYNKKAWDSHNLLHTPNDLYINNEADRKLAVARVDQDFDHSRVPSLLDKLLPVGRPRQSTPDTLTTASNNSQPSSTNTIDTTSVTTQVIKSVVEGGKNRAVVDSDSDDDKSDTSIESDEESPPKKKKRSKNM